MKIHAMPFRVATAALVLAPVAAFATSIDTKTIDERVRTKREAVAACYDEGLARKPKLAGKILVLFVVENDGTVSDASAKKGTTLKDETVVNCVLGEIKTLVFPPMGDDCDASRDDCTVKITYPFTFTP